MQLSRAAALWSLVLAGCGALPAIPLNQCGNHIVEAGEDCDSSDPRCVPSGEPHACHLRCSAFPAGCPVGDVCDENACVASAGACGNRIVEAGEDCDGSVGCIAAGQPGACHMSCSAYPDSQCPPQLSCDGDGACVPAPGACGNGYLDPGEECDGIAGCIPAGQPGACHLRCEAQPSGHCPAGSLCDADDRCVAQSGVCGNLVVEAGEDCDGSIGCGQPGGATACRFSCESVACASGYRCGNDRICRRPTGLYTWTATIGNPDEAFALADLDGDGVPDLIGRGPSQTTLWHNDGTGALTVSASGRTPPRPTDQPTAASAIPALPSPGVALTHDGSQSLLVALTPSTADIFGIYPSAAGGAAIQPMVTVGRDIGASPDETLVSFISNMLPVGGPDWLALFSGEGADGPQLDVYYDWGPLASTVHWQLDVAQLCGRKPLQPLRMTTTVDSNWVLHVILVIDDQYLCVIDDYIQLPPPPGPHLPPWPPNVQTIDVAAAFEQLQSSTPLQARPLPRLRPHDVVDMIGQASEADFDGDGLLDLISSLPGGNTSFLYWKRQADGTFAPPILLLDDDAPDPSSQADPLTTSDLDGDGKADLLFAGHAFRIVAPYANAPLASAGFYAYPAVQPTEAATVLVGDINGDGRTDFVQGFGLRSDVIVCRQPVNNNGFPSFVCNDEPTSLAAVRNLALADVNGDGRQDIVTVGPGTGAWGGQPLLSLVLGGDVDFTPPPPQLFAGYNGALVAVGPLYAGSSARVGLYAIMRTADGHYHLTNSSFYTDGSVAFGLGNGFDDLRSGDFDGDGQRDLLFLSDGARLLLPGPHIDSSDPRTNPPYDWNPAISGGHFLDYPGESGPLIISADATELGWWDPTSTPPEYHVTSTGLTTPGFLSSTSWLAGLDDVDGNGTPELVAIDPACDVYVSPIVGHQAALRRIEQNPVAGGGYQCEGVFFTDVAPQDGVPDAIYEVRRGSEPTTHLMLSRARADGTYDGQTTQLDPTLTKTPLPAGAKWVASRDFNGDGIPDLLFWTPEGAILALAEVERR